MKKQSNLSRLLTYAGRYRSFTYASWILSAMTRKRMAEKMKQYNNALENMSKIRFLRSETV